LLVLLEVLNYDDNRETTEPCASNVWLDCRNVELPYGFSNFKPC